MTPEDWIKWVSYSMVEPWALFPPYLGSALVAATAANLVSKRRLSPEDFLPSTELEADEQELVHHFEILSKRGLAREIR